MPNSWTYIFSLQKRHLLMASFSSRSCSQRRAPFIWQPGCVMCRTRACSNRVKHSSWGSKTLCVSTKPTYGLVWFCRICSAQAAISIAAPPVLSQRMGTGLHISKTASIHCTSLEEICSKFDLFFGPQTCYFDLCLSWPQTWRLTLFKSMGWSQWYLYPWREDHQRHE